MPLTKPTVGYFKFYYGSEKFSFEFIADLKGAVPFADREYDPDTKEWTIAERWFSVIRQLWDQYYKSPNHGLFEED